MSLNYTSNAQLLISKSALLSNLNTYRSLLEKNTKLLLMVKANGYGTDLLEVALAVQDKVDYLAAAYSSSAYLLNKKGIKTPIMVMAPEPADLVTIAEQKLEPVLYSLEIIEAAVATEKSINAHIEIDSGMRRIGLKKEDLPKAIDLLLKSKINVTSIFSHLAAPSEPKHDTFTHEQANYFEECFEELSSALNIKPLKHLVSSGGINRFPQYQFDLVRLGIGFYGFDPTELIQKEIMSMATLQTKVLQVIDVKKGETIGYSRNDQLLHNGKIATLSVGYGDGYLRAYGNGNASVFINGKRARTVGNICMDLTMIDVTNVDCKPGDLVELFGPNITIAEMARCATTIPYEVLTNVSPRVERMVVE